MHWELRMHLTKKFVNLATRILCRFVPEAKATYPQTKMLEDIFAKLQHAYQIEVYAGRFDDVPFQTLKGLKDKHFLKFLELSKKIIIYLGENDRYYRQWLGFAMLLNKDRVEQELEKLSFEDFLRLTNNQWDFDLRGAVRAEYFEVHKKEFLDIVLANFLMNLA